MYTTEHSNSSLSKFRSYFAEVTFPHFTMQGNSFQRVVPGLAVPSVTWELVRIMLQKFRSLGLAQTS
jgi:hypothetical protein